MNINDNLANRASRTSDVEKWGVISALVQLNDSRCVASQSQSIRTLPPIGQGTGTGRHYNTASPDDTRSARRYSAASGASATAP